MSWVLCAAACYNLSWGTFVVLFPSAMFDWFGMAQPNYPQLWQCIGMMVGVFGVGYACAAVDPMRHWPMVLVGLLGKVFGPIGFLLAAPAGDLPWVFGIVNITNDVIWWVPFALILHHKYRSVIAEGDTPPVSLAEALAGAVDEHGVSLDALSRRGPVLVTFLRHLG
jgi:hypothetical protein